MTKQDKQYPELDYLKELIVFRINEFLGKENHKDDGSNYTKPVFPALSDWGFYFQRFIDNYQINELENAGDHKYQDELTILLVALIPYISPGLFDETIEKATDKTFSFPQIGGIRTKHSRFFVPTGETVIFLLGGGDINRRLAVMKMFSTGHFFSQKKIIELEKLEAYEPPMNGRLILSPDCINLLVYDENLI